MKCHARNPLLILLFLSLANYCQAQENDWPNTLELAEGYLKSGQLCLARKPIYRSIELAQALCDSVGTETECVLRMVKSLACLADYKSAIGDVLKARSLYIQLYDSLAPYLDEPNLQHLRLTMQKKLVQTMEAAKPLVDHIATYNTGKGAMDFILNDFSSFDPDTAFYSIDQDTTVILPSWDVGRVAGERKVLSFRGIELVFRWIPPGEQTIGSNPADPCHSPDECEWNAAFSQGFWIQETELTDEQYSAITGRDPSDCLECPKTLTWYEAKSALEKLNSRNIGGHFRLPSEAEWEYAARAGSETPFAFPCADYLAAQRNEDVECLDSFARWGGNADGEAGPYPCGKLNANAWGLFDMHGNVWEWCEDVYNEYPMVRETDYVNTSGSWEELRVIRGGSWNILDVTAFRSAYRGYDQAAFPNREVGIRLVREAVEAHSSKVRR